MQIKGYCPRTSVSLGDLIEFCVSTTPNETYTIKVFRVGHYGGAGARLMTTSPLLRGESQDEPRLDIYTGMVACNWKVSWSFTLPRNWTSGCYIAAFTTASGWRSYYPFVVRDQNPRAALCVVLPIATYQAYNMWPQDGLRGKSLYYGYESIGVDKATTASVLHSARARKVSFDRPYAGGGIPQGFDIDSRFISWSESLGLDMTYASNIDLHNGTIESDRFTGLVFCGHDEYWSKEMRDNATAAVASGTSLAFMSANNVYWHVRFEPAPDGRDDRILVCYKTDLDPNADTTVGETRTWRAGRPGPSNSEQSLLGVMYSGVLSPPAPLVVQAADHWFWCRTGVNDGDRIENVVGGEADGFHETVPVPQGVRQTLLSASPYRRSDTKTDQVQNTSIYETTKGAVVFVAGSLIWAESLIGAKVDPRIQQATANVLNRIAQKQWPPASA